MTPMQRLEQMRKQREQEKREQWARILAALRAQTSDVEIPHVDGADENDPETADGFSVMISPDGYFVVYHCYSQPFDWYGEGQLNVDGIDEDTMDLPLSGVGLSALEERIFYGLNEALSGERANAVRKPEEGTLAPAPPAEGGAL